MLLLDTHALVWLASDLKQLTKKATRRIEAEVSALYLSPISALEIALLVKRDRLLLPVPPLEFVDRALANHGIQEVPFDRRIAVASAMLPDIHNDPFDRIIIATAMLCDMTILTKDKTIPTYPNIRTVWR